MTTSIIIATMNRSRELALMLPTLVAQSISAIEIIVIDASADTSTKDLVERCTDDLARSNLSAPSLIYIHEQKTGGLGAARNVGIERAKGDILVFLDDDVLLEGNFLEELIAVYRAHPALGGVSGIVTNYVRPGLYHRLIRRLFWTGPFHDERQPVYWKADQLRDHPPVRVCKLTGCVMSLKRNVFHNDRFDQGGGCAFPIPEDIDLSWRISERSALVIAPRARLVHLRTDSGRPRKHWLWSDALGSYYLYQRNWKVRLKHRLCFTLLNFGYATIATIASVRRWSLEPWRALVKGARVGRQEGRRRVLG